MANSLQDLLRAKREETERWMRQRENELRHGVADLEARGRRVYSDAVRKGEKVVARTTHEVRELGRAAVRKADEVRATVLPKAPAGKPGANARTAPPRGAPATPAGNAVRENFRAATSGAVDEFTFGLADRALSAGEAILGNGPDGFVASYSENMNRRKAADAYDAEHYGLARNTGRVVGAVGSVAAMGAPAVLRGALMAVPRSAGARQAAQLGLRYAPDPRGLSKMFVVGGAGAGMIDQGVADALTGRRTDVVDYVKAGAGGALGGLITRYAGPTAGGAAGGASASVLEDLARGDKISFDRALNEGRLDAITGGAVGRYVTKSVSKLPQNLKGEIGELLSGFKGLARGDEIVGRQRRFYMEPGNRQGGFTVADHEFRTRDGRMVLGESKLGPEATLSERQLQARDLLGDDYVVDYWRFSDVGKVGGGALAPLGSAVINDEPPMTSWR